MLMKTINIYLGHQAIVEAFGEDKNIEYVSQAKVGPMYRKESKIFHDR